jgi:protein kinase A
LIASFLEQDVSKRLGCLSGGTEDIKNNEWFQGVDWALVKYKRIQPPWIPELSSGQDMQYFDNYPDSEGTYEPLSADEQKLFVNF